MKLSKTAVASILILMIFMLCYSGWLNDKAKGLKAENEQLLNNQDVLLTEAESYRVADSLNAVQVVELSLTLEEYKRYRAEDAALIKQLKAKVPDKVISANTQSNISINIPAHDTVYIKEDTPISVHRFDYKSKWFDINGCLYDDTVNLHIASRDALKIVESVEYKRFLGFLWYTNKVKRRQVDVVSENPATTITNIEYISVRH